MDYLDKQNPGTKSRLSDLWFFSAKRAIHCPGGDPPRVQGVMTVAADLMKTFRWARTARRMTPKSSAKMKSDEDQAHLVHVGEAIRGSQVGREQARTNTHRGISKRSHTPPTSSSPFIGRRRGSAVEVHAGHQIARRPCLRSFVGSRGRKFPTGAGAAQASYIKPIVFTEAEALAITRRLKMSDAVTMRGIEATGAVGEIQMWGDMAGTIRQPLDMSTELVATQHGVANKLRFFNLPFKHSDGYRETAKPRSVSFSTKPQPHRV